MARAMSAEPIQLRWTEGDRRVVIALEDQHRLAATVDEVIHACRMRQKSEDVSQVLNDLWQALASWCGQHAEKIKAAFCTVRDSGLLFVVVAKGVAFDRDLQDELVDLEIQIARDEQYEQLQLTTLALPNCQPEGYWSFLNPSFCVSFEPPDAT